MKRTFVVTISTIWTYIKLAQCAPVSEKSKLPYWYRPCGGSGDVVVADLKNIDDEIRANLKNVKIQHELMMNDYLSRDYEYLYERVRIGVHEHQYIPNWLPGKRDVHFIKRLAKEKPQMIVNYLPKMHADLQKFAVAFEQMIEDESNLKRIQDALKTTQSYLHMMICEVESSILSLPILQLPPRIDRDIMKLKERQMEDDTRRLIRDWGILIRYKNYLHAWRHVFNY